MYTKFESENLREEITWKN